MAGDMETERAFVTVPRTGLLAFRDRLEQRLSQIEEADPSRASRKAPGEPVTPCDWRDAQIVLLKEEVALLREEIAAVQRESAAAREAHDRQVADLKASLDRMAESRDRAVSSLRSRAEREGAVLAEFRSKLQARDATLAELRARHEEACRSRDRLQAELQQQIDAYTTSLSWRITRPLRDVSALVRRLAGRS